MASIEELDSDISAIRAQIASLRHRRANLSSILLSTPRLSTRLQQKNAPNKRLHDNANKIIKQQSNRNLENTYRACAGVTAYKVKDPDPNAVDNGNILGVRLEVFVGGKFVDTYNVLFNRPSARHKTMLKIHKHTIPACIPVRQLANKFLPQSQNDASTTTEQNLVKFGRILRQELVSWHMRTAAVEKLRVEAGLGDKEVQDRRQRPEPAYGKVLNAFTSSDDEEESDEEEEERRRVRNGPVKISDIEADMSVRQIHISWTNGQTGAMEVTKDGEIVNAAIKQEDGRRIPDLSRRAIGRIEGLVQRLSS